MATIREELERRERDILAPQGAKSADSRGRLRPEAEDDVRPAFQRDRDRIIHSKAFRRLNLTWEVRDGIAKHSKGKSGAPVGMAEAQRAGTIEGQIMRVADMIAYVNHDIDDATRAGLLKPDDLPREPVRMLGSSSSARIATLVKDVVTETLGGELTEIRMSDTVLEAVL